MKKKQKKSIPTTCKFSTKYGLKQVLGQISHIISGKCKKWNIRLDAASSSDDGLTIHASSRARSAPCPICGSSSKRIHSYRPRKLQDLEFMGTGVTIMLTARHFRCDNPDCTKKIFSEPLEIAGRYKRMTRDAYERTRYESINQTAPSAVRSLRLQHINTSPSTCQRIVRNMGTCNPHVHTSGYVGIDDFAKKKGRVYACKIVDHYTRDVVAVFDTRYGNEISEWFASHREIRLVTRDGSQSYADLIGSASPGIVQVSDRFHLIKNLKDTAVDLIVGLLGKKQKKMEYPYPSEAEAYDLIFSDILSMGDERHRTRVREYYQIRKLKDEGKSITEISTLLSLTPKRVYKRLHTDIYHTLSREQRKTMPVARRMAGLVASGMITPKTVLNHLGDDFPSRLVHRCMRSIVSKYTELRKEVREHNAKHQDKNVRIRKSAIWEYIRTGNTTSDRLLLLGKTHPHVQQVIDICMHFCNMIYAREGAPNIAEWIKEAECSPYSLIKSFALYIRKDRKAVEQAYLTNYSNALLEGNVNRTKAIKRGMYNRAGIKALRAKIIYQGRPDALRFCT